MVYMKILEEDKFDSEKETGTLISRAGRGGTYLERDKLDVLGVHSRLVNQLVRVDVCPRGHGRYRCCRRRRRRRRLLARRDHFNSNNKHTIKSASDAKRK